VNVHWKAALSIALDMFASPHFGFFLSHLQLFSILPSSSKLSASRRASVPRHSPPTVVVNFRSPSLFL
jgi:hypothetical protein